MEDPPQLFYKYLIVSCHPPMRYKGHGDPPLRRVNKSRFPSTRVVREREWEKEEFAIRNDCVQFPFTTPVLIIFENPSKLTLYMPD